jgi:hypothetical protein
VCIFGYDGYAGKIFSNDLNLLISDSFSFSREREGKLSCKSDGIFEKASSKNKTLIFSSVSHETEIQFSGLERFFRSNFPENARSTAYDGFFRVYAIVCNYIFDAFGNR